MSVRVVKLPDVGEGIADAEIVEWLVDVGDHVAEGDPVVSVMTDKATVELPSPASGTVASLAGGAGTIVPVGSELFTLTDSSAHVGADPFADVAPAPAPPPPSPPPPPPADATEPRRARALASPTVRRRAGELGVTLTEVTGTGPEGRIRHEDLDRYLVEQNGDRPTVRAPEDPVASEDAVDRIPLSGLRRSIARRMARSSERIPHFTYVEEVDVTELQRTRLALAAEWGLDEPVGVLPFVMRAVVVALRDHPEMNARFLDRPEGDAPDDGTLSAAVIERHRAVHLGIAVQTDLGLVVTVARDAQERDVRGCAAELARLSTAARDGSAGLEDLRGSTITISSLGAAGGIAATPIINHPEVAVVGVNKIEDRPVVRDGAVVVRQCMNLSASFDHRVVDGWDAANFVQRIRSILETPALLFDP